jgi:hypothetical protein
VSKEECVEILKQGNAETLNQGNAETRKSGSESERETRPRDLPINSVIRYWFFKISAGVLEKKYYEFKDDWISSPTNNANTVELFKSWDRDVGALCNLT